MLIGWKDYLVSLKNRLTIPHVELVLLLMRELTKGPQSFYKPYLDTLPQDVTLPVMFEGHEFHFLKDTSVGGEAWMSFVEMCYGFACMYRKVGI